MSLQKYFFIALWSEWEREKAPGNLMLYIGRKRNSNHLIKPIQDSGLDSAGSGQRGQMSSSTPPPYHKTMYLVLRSHFVCTSSYIQCCRSGSGQIRSFWVTWIWIRENTKSGSGPLIHKKTPCNSKFLIIKLSKIQFCPNNFFIFDFKCHNTFFIFHFKCHRMFRFGKKMP